MGQQAPATRGRGSGCSRPGYGINPLGGGRHYPHHRAARTYTGLGNRLLEGTREPCVHQDQGEGAATPQEPTLDVPASVQESPVEVWAGGGLLQGLGAPTVVVRAWDLLREVTVTFITSTMVWPQVNNRKGTQSHPSTENLIKDLLSMALPIKTRPSFPLRQSPIRKLP